MTRLEYQREITKQLNEIEGRDGYCFHVMTHQGVEEKFVEAVKDAVDSLADYSADDRTDHLNAENAMIKFAKVAAMCMIAMDLANLRKQMVLTRLSDEKKPNNVYKKLVSVDFGFGTENRFIRMLEEMEQTHKSHWMPNSKGGEPNCRR